MSAWRVVTVVLVLAGLAAAAGAQAQPDTGPEPLVEVVVALDAPALAEAGPARSLSARSGRRRLSLRAPASVSYLRTLASAQRTLTARISSTLPGASVRWRFRVVANGLAVVLPADRVDALARLPGVRTVYPSVRYHPTLDRSPQQIGAPALWGPTLATAGQGVKIGIIDDGIDQRHPFFDPAGYAMPAGFPKGQRAFTTAKVIVARAFPPPSPTWKFASRPFDPQHSGHATHVAGIAAGNNGTTATVGSRPKLSGVAPKAYLGNYKVLTIPTDAGVGLDGNSPEIVAAIEAAVRDGMDVVNLSLGEAEIEPSRDVVALALDAAAKAGVVPVVAAGNDFEDFGRGSLGSPANSSRAITVGAVTTTRSGPPGVMAGFSSSGPSPLSLRMKPDVSAPGVSILSSLGTGWQLLSGTSMASPHVAGAAALLRERHPGWTVEQLRSALTQTGDPAFLDDARTKEAPTTRAGGGVVNLVRADAPLVFAVPSSLSFGLVRRGTAATATVLLSDAGGGAGEWLVTVEPQSPVPGLVLSVPPAVTVPGTLPIGVDTAAVTADAEATGFVVLTRGTDRRRIPFWLRATQPVLSSEPASPLAKPGLHRGNTRGRPALVSAYRYPETPVGLGFATTLAGPEQVFRVRVPRRIANFGVVITQRARGVRVEPRIVRAGDENRLAGLVALPFNLNPYLRGYGDLVLAAGVVRPERGDFDVVFDSGTAAGAGAFTFRFWLNDQRPPAVTFVTLTVPRGRPLVVGLSDAGSGVDPASLRIAIDERELAARPRDGQVRLATGALARGRHSLRIQVSDYQETRNMENSGRILPNTRVVATSFAVR